MREHFRLGFIVKEYILFESKYGRGRPNSIASEYFISLFIILIKHSHVSLGMPIAIAPNRSLETWQWPQKHVWQKCEVGEGNEVSRCGV